MPVELLADGVERQRHVVARVAVGDREDIEVVDFLASRFEVEAAAVSTRRKRSIEGSAIECPGV